MKHGTRIGSIDTARFLAIALVFYGHLVEQVMYLVDILLALKDEDSYRA